jgi:putative flippase GtrA
VSPDGQQTRTAPNALPGQLLSFAVVGAICTVVYLACFALFADYLATQAANVCALLASAVLNTALNRRLTFGVVGRERVAAHHMQALGAFAAGLVITAGALALLEAADATPSRSAQIAVLVGATAVATVARFAILRFWVFADAH